MLHTKYPAVTEITELVPLALQIARFKILSGVRTQVRRGESNALQVDELMLADPGSPPDDLLDRKRWTESMIAAMKSLGERCRELMRYKLEGRSFSEIQTIFKVESINTIYTWDFRCRKQLREKLGGSWEAKP